MMEEIFIHACEKSTIASQRISMNASQDEKKLSAINSHFKINGYNGDVVVAALFL
jgi:hypothetical protein